MIDDYVLIIGAIKAGTTSLFHYLADHPQIAPCSIKEPSFFADPDVWKRGLDWYNGLWEWDPGIHRWALEASTDYAMCRRWPKTTDRIASIRARFRFLYVVRNPFDRIESHYNHGFRSGWDSRDMTIDEAVSKRPWLIETTMYARQLDAYQRKFETNVVLVLEFSRLTEDPLHELSRVCDFLEIDSTFVPSNVKQVYNAGKGRKLEHPLLAKITANRSLARALGRLVPKSIQAFVRRSLSRREAPQFRLSPTARERVFETLREDMCRLEQNYGVDVSEWKP